LRHFGGRKITQREVQFPELFQSTKLKKGPKMEGPGPSGTKTTTTSTPARSGNRRPSSYFGGVCTPMVMKKKPKRAAVQQSPIVDLEYEDISNVPLPPNITMEEGEITIVANENLSVLVVGEVQSPVANRLVVPEPPEDQSIVIVQEVNRCRNPPAPPRIRDKSPFIRKLRRKSGKKTAPYENYYQVQK